MNDKSRMLSNANSLDGPASRRARDLNLTPADLFVRYGHSHTDRDRNKSFPAPRIFANAQIMRRCNLVVSLMCHQHWLASILSHEGPYRELMILSKRRDIGYESAMSPCKKAELCSSFSYQSGQRTNTKGHSLSPTVIVQTFYPAISPFSVSEEEYKPARRESFWGMMSIIAFGFLVFPFSSCAPNCSVLDDGAVGQQVQEEVTPPLSSHRLELPSCKRYKYSTGRLQFPIEGLQYEDNGSSYSLLLIQIANLDLAGCQSRILPPAITAPSRGLRELISQPVIERLSHSGHGVSHSGHGVSHSEHGVSHSGHGVSHSGHGVSHPERGVSHSGHGVSRSGHGVSHSEHGVSHSGHGVSHSGHGVSHSEHGVSHSGHGVSHSGHGSFGHGVSHSGHGVSHSGHGVSHFEHGVSRSGHGVSSFEHGISHFEHGISHFEHGVSRSGHGVSHSEHGVSHSGHGVSHSEHEVSHSEHGVSKPQVSV
ncbi:hypothetical protein J6590_077903 [Homalodisca vitripennis]|nr:hypothetical protein J6590_077903 [Homalodisca vitripennis]